MQVSSDVISVSHLKSSLHIVNVHLTLVNGTSISYHELKCLQKGEGRKYYLRGSQFQTQRRTF